jgi:hypothetical protein
VSSYALNRLAELAPSLNDDEGQAFARALGGAQDDELLLLRVAALCRLVAFCPDDALDGVGAWLNIERFPGEVDGTALPPTGYRGRLLAAWETWAKAGSAQAIIDSLNGWGLPDVAVFGTPEWPYIDPLDPATWIKGSYSNIFPVIGPDFGSTGIGPQLWGSFNWGDPDMTWGSSATPAQIAQIEGQILKWKFASSLPVKVVLTFGGQFVWGVSEFGGPDTWGDVGGESPCQWLMSNVWGADMLWGEFNWGNARSAP